MTRTKNVINTTTNNELRYNNQLNLHVSVTFKMTICSKSFKIGLLQKNSEKINCVNKLSERER